MLIFAERKQDVDTIHEYLLLKVWTKPLAFLFFMLSEGPALHGYLRVGDPHHFNVDPDPAFFSNLYPDPDPHQIDGNLRPPVYRPATASFWTSRHPLWASTSITALFWASKACKIWLKCGSSSSFQINAVAVGNPIPTGSGVMFAIKYYVICENGRGKSPETFAEKRKCWFLPIQCKARIIVVTKLKETENVKINNNANVLRHLLSSIILLKLPKLCDLNRVFSFLFFKPFKTGFWQLSGT